MNSIISQKAREIRFITKVKHILPFENEMNMNNYYQGSRKERTPKGIYTAKAFVKLCLVSNLDGNISLLRSKQVYTLKI